MDLPVLAPPLPISITQSGPSSAGTAPDCGIRGLMRMAPCPRSFCVQSFFTLVSYGILIGLSSTLKEKLHMRCGGVRDLYKDWWPKTKHSLLTIFLSTVSEFSDQITCKKFTCVPMHILMCLTSFHNSIAFSFLCMFTA